MNWKKLAIWAGSIIAGLLFLVVLAVVVLLRSDAAHRYILARAEQSASESLGSPVKARDFKLILFPIRLELDNVSVAGSGSHPEPLLRVDRIGASVKILSVLHRKWQLRDLELVHPVAHIYVDSSGNTNLPHSTNSNNNSQTNLFDLAVQHAALTNGEVYYNDRKTPLDADLHNFQFNSSFDLADGGRYFGDISYDNGHLRFGTYAPLPHSLKAHFDAVRSGIKLQRVLLTSGPSSFALNASIENYSAPVLIGTYNAVLATEELRRVLHDRTLPLGVIHLDGSLQYRTDPNRTLMETVALQGRVFSPSLRVQTPQLTTDITEIAADYALANGDARVSNVKAHLLGGELTAQLLIRDLTGDSSSHLQASIRGLSLAALNPALKQMATSPSIQPVSLSGTLNADADATWGNTMQNLVANADADIHAGVTPGAGKAGLVQSPAPAADVPLTSTIHARYVAADKQITLTNSSIRTPQTSVALNGTLSNRSSLQVRIVSDNLHELEMVVDAFRKPTPGQAPQRLGLFGRATFTGAATGRTDAPRITGQLVTNDLRIKNSRWKLIRTDLDLSPSLARLRNGIAEPPDQGQLTFNIQAGLHDWSYTSSSPIEAAVGATQLSVGDLLHAAGSTAPVTGLLNAAINVHGSQENPIGSGKLSLSKGRIAEESLQVLNAEFQGTGQEIHATVNARIPAGAAQVNLVYYPKQQAYDVSVQAPNLRLDRVKTLASKNLGIAGLLTLTASGRGTIEDPQFHASVTIPQLSLRNQNINDISLQAVVQNKMANLSLDSNALNRYIRARATTALTGDYETTATLDTARIPLQPLVAMYSPAQASDFSGQTELHASLRGPLKNKNALQAQVELPLLTVNYKTIQLGAVAPIRANYKDGVATLEPSQIRGTGTDLRFRGSIPLSGSAPTSLLLLGTVDLRLLEIADPTLDSSGQLQFDINSFGDRANLNTQGQIRVVNANLATTGAPIGLQSANGILTLRNDRLDVTQFQGKLGGGDVTAKGAIIYRNGLQFDLAVAANGVRIAYPQGVRTALDADLALTGTTDNSMLRGQIRIDGLYFTPDFDVSSVMTQFSSAATPPPSGGMTQNMQLQIAVQSTSQINAVSRTVSIKGSTNLRITGTADQPVVLGRIDINGGDLLFLGNRYVIQGGTIAFVNAVQTQPVFNVQASTVIEQYNIQLRFQGPVDRLRTSYTSDPSLPPVDIIHLLAFGSTTESAAANPTPGNLGAESVLAQGISNQVTSRIQKVAGISHLAIDPTLGSTNQTNPGARISVQQRVTSNLFVTFETDVTETQRQVIQVQYQLNPRWSISGTRDQNGGFGFDARVHKTF